MVGVQWEKLTSCCIPLVSVKWGNEALLFLEDFINLSHSLQSAAGPKARKGPFSEGSSYFSYNTGVFGVIFYVVVLFFS